MKTRAFYAKLFYLIINSVKFEFVCMIRKISVGNNRTISVENVDSLLTNATLYIIFYVFILFLIVTAECIVCSSVIILVMRQINNLELKK